jgi:hypothetical protein
LEKQLHRPRHGQEKKVLWELAALPKRRGEAGVILERERNYIAAQAGRMNYQQIARGGWPIGSGAVESACRQRKCRRKRPGQFWKQSGLRHLEALEEAGTTVTGMNSGSPLDSASVKLRHLQNSDCFLD